VNGEIEYFVNGEIKYFVNGIKYVVNGLIKYANELCIICVNGVELNYVWCVQ